MRQAEGRSVLGRCVGNFRFVEKILVNLVFKCLGSQRVVQHSSRYHIRRCLSDFQLGFDFAQLHLRLDILRRTIRKLVTEFAGLQDRVLEIC